MVMGQWKYWSHDRSAALEQRAWIDGCYAIVRDMLILNTNSEYIYIYVSVRFNQHNRTRTYACHRMQQMLMWRFKSFDRVPLHMHWLTCRWQIKDSSYSSLLRLIVMEVLSSSAVQQAVLHECKSAVRRGQMNTSLKKSRKEDTVLTTVVKMHP
jgi:hypothetical protein